ncbi:hypothetical protein J2Z70_004125 [Paenibacillus silagei]|uniref:Bacteriocin n=1 Tax=Paenibacillus silagei TaxID=1670801 RepID=A0ABS4NWZ5_9BACL|nr:hypothetical protein [Paenibacillus silagei]
MKNLKSEVIGPDVCEKENTLCWCQGNPPKCIRKTEHNRSIRFNRVDKLAKLHPKI